MLVLSSATPHEAGEGAWSTPHTPHWPPSHAVLPRAVRPAHRMRHAVVSLESDVSTCFLQQVVRLNTKLVCYLRSVQKAVVEDRVPSYQPALDMSASHRRAVLTFQCPTLCAAVARAQLQLGADRIVTPLQHCRNLKLCH